jgi:uncharacterized coiled-coil protein SlyX
MTSTIQLKTIIPSLFIALTLFCFTAVPKAFGVSPPPDGGYPGGNTAEGQSALFSRTTGGYNTAVGYLSLRSDSTGSLNTAVGAGTLLANTADSNTAVGGGALLSNTTGTNNTATGAFALFANTTGSDNTATGAGALFSDQSGGRNTAFGSAALYSNVSGGSNTAIGYQALLNSTGSSNTALGDAAGFSVITANNVICIGADGQNVSNSCYIGNIAGQTVGAGGSTCYVDNDGKLGVFLSARRFKTDIADMAAASEAILCLHPVTFHYKPELDKTGIPQFGLVAEEVAKVNPDLVTRDRDGKLQTVRYEAVNAMLLNEFLKEHRKVQEQACEIQEQRATINELSSAVAQQQEEMKAFAATLKEQASQIQRVSAQVEVNKPASQTVLNND